MKTKEELTEDVGLVRDIESWAKRRLNDDHERGFLDSLCRKACVEMPKMEIPHVRRINEALCEKEFPSATVLGTLRCCIELLSKHHNLKTYRTARIPMVSPATPAGKN